MRMISSLGNRLSKISILLVGAAGNLGPEWARALLGEGALVYAVGLETRDNPELARLAREFPERLLCGDLDVTQDLTARTIENALSQPEGALRLDGVVLNAGIDSPPGANRSEVSSFDIREWERIFRVNVFGAVNVLSAVVDVMANPSAAVAVGSIYGLISPRVDLYDHFFEGAGAFKHPAYGASKAALLSVVRQFGTHLAPRGIRVNALTLGGVEGGQDTAFVEKFVNQVPQNRMVPLDEISGAMIFLLSDDSLSMNSQNLVIDGGYSAW